MSVFSSFDSSYVPRLKANEVITTVMNMNVFIIDITLSFLTFFTYICNYHILVIESF
jgi:hypothetical protein